jgi:protein O-mannosyl-transferase
MPFVKFLVRVQDIFEFLALMSDSFGLPGLHPPDRNSTCGSLALPQLDSSEAPFYKNRRANQTRGANYNGASPGGETLAPAPRPYNFCMALQAKRITADRAVLFGIALAVLAYLRDLRYDFILDDVPLILLNESITSWRYLKSIFFTHVFAAENPMFLGPSEIHYRPIYKLWLLLNAQMFGAVLPWWHLTSLLLHVGVTLLVYQLGIKLLKDRWAAALGAMLFAVHPIHAESVAYVTASTDPLVAFFALISFLFYFRYREEGGSLAFFIASISAASLAMLSKETAVMFPWMLVAYEGVREIPPGTRRGWTRYLWTLPFFAVVGAYVAVRTILFGMSLGPAPAGSRLAASLDLPLVLVAYLHNLFVPFRLSFFYPAEWGSQWTVWRGCAVAVVAAAAYYLWRRYSGRSGVRLQLLWMGLLFVPPLLGVYAFGSEDWIHDRHMYLVSIPLCLLIATVLTDLKWPAKVPILASSAAMAILLIGLAIQVPKFSDNDAIYASAEKVAPRSLPLHAHYGAALWGSGRTDEARREFQIATELAPQSPFTHEWYAGTLADLGRDDQAVAEYQKALELSGSAAPFRAYILSKLAKLELKHLKFPEAAAHLREAVRLAPDTPDYYPLLAQALTREGQTGEADEVTRVEAGLRQRIAGEHGVSKVRE